MKNKDKSPSTGRRKLLQGIGAGALILGANEVTSSSSLEISPSKAKGTSKGYEYDIVVVGGGHAGVAAARDSMENGYKTLLLEARNRLGGRTFTADFEGADVELGGTWIHSTQPFVWAEKERYDLDVVEIPSADPEHMYVLHDGQRIELGSEQLLEVVMGWQIYMHASREIMPQPWDILHNRDMALKMDQINALQYLEQLELSSLQKNVIIATVRTIAHNSPDAISYLEVMRWFMCGGGYLPTFMDATVRLQLKGGTEAMIKHMLDDGRPEVRLSTPVKSINDRGSHVELETTRGEIIRSAAVICCLPMNTIHNINFSPALPNGTVAAAKERHTGSGFKVYLKVKGDVGNISSSSPDHSLAVVMTYKKQIDSTLLVAFGSDPKNLDVYDDDALQKALRDHIPGAELISSMSYDWNSDPYSQGTYASYKPGWVGRYLQDFQQDQGRILFGSSDHGEGWRGFIDGAIGAGIKAAERAKKVLG